MTEISKANWTKRVTFLDTKSKSTRIFVILKHLIRFLICVLGTNFGSIHMMNYE